MSDIINEFRVFLIDEVLKLKAQSPVVRSSMAVEIKVRMLEELLVFINNKLRDKGEISMQDLKQGIVTHVVKLEDFETKRAPNQLYERLSEDLKTLKDDTSKALVINEDVISYAVLQAAISKFKKTGKLPFPVKVSRRRNKHTGEKATLIVRA